VARMLYRCGIQGLEACKHDVRERTNAMPPAATG
jgi:hypothetical protein